MLVLVGASASGKTIAAQYLIKHYNFRKLVTYTTRPMRGGEVDGSDYHFVTPEQFATLDDQNEFIETTLYQDNYYGSPVKGCGKNVVVILEPQGANVFYHRLGNQVCIILISADQETRRARMIARGDATEDIEKRLANDEFRFDPQALTHIDAIIENNANHQIADLAAEIVRRYQMFEEEHKQ